MIHIKRTETHPHLHICRSLEFVRTRTCIYAVLLEFVRSRTCIC